MNPENRAKSPKIFTWLTNLPAAFLIFLVRTYQCTLSHWLGGHCKFHPTCSEYCIQAVKKHGALRGGLLAAWRIIRCNPFSKGGCDPVP